MPRRRLHLLDGAVYDETSLLSFHNTFFPNQSANGCDSIVIEHLDFLNPIHTLDVYICPGSSYTFLDGTVHNNIIQNESYTSVFHDQAASGCDSMVIERINFLNTFELVDVYICPGSSYTFLDGTVHDNIIQNESYASVFPVQTSSGCDSIVVENVLLLEHQFINKYICLGDSYTFPDGITHNNIVEDEVYVCNLPSTTSSDCDSIIIFNLIIDELSAHWSESISLSADTVALGDTLWLNSGIFDTDSTPLSYAISKPQFIPDNGGDTTYYTSAISTDMVGTIQSVSDIKGIGINIEHSYSGDLSIRVECPNGQALEILPYPNHCTSHHLGEACDFNCLSETIGKGYDYYFKPTATFSLLSVRDVFMHDFLDNCGNIINNQPYFPSGEYLPTGSFDNLIGCPIEGEWKLHVSDYTGLDNGYVFDWHITFANQYETFWTGDFIDHANSLSTFAIPNQTGLQNYTFSIEDAHNCVFDTTLSVFVSESSNLVFGRQNEQANIQIYPNPSEDFVYVKGVPNAIGRIYNVNGTLIKEVQNIQDPIDVQKLPKGIYLLDIQSDNVKKQFKLVKL